MPHYLSKNEAGTKFQAWQFGNPRTEAKALFIILGRNGDTEESLLKLIRVTPQEQVTLRDCAARYHDLSDHIEQAIQFREKVEEEFKRIAKKHILEQPAVIGIVAGK